MPARGSTLSRSYETKGDMSARKLGGGRVLGSGRSLSPVYPARKSSLLSPTASSVSVSSSSQPSTDAQDLSSRISLDQSDGDSAAAAALAASTRLACPICNEEMVRFAPSISNSTHWRSIRLRYCNWTDILMTRTRTSRRSDKMKPKIGLRLKWSRRSDSSHWLCWTRSSKGWMSWTRMTDHNHPSYRQALGLRNPRNLILKKSSLERTGRGMDRMMLARSRRVARDSHRPMARWTAENVASFSVTSILCIRWSSRDQRNTSRWEVFGARFVRHATSQGKATMTAMATNETTLQILSDFGGRRLIRLCWKFLGWRNVSQNLHSS